METDEKTLVKDDYAIITGKEDTLFHKAYGKIRGITEDGLHAQITLDKQFSYIFGVFYSPEKSMEIPLSSLKRLSLEGNPEIRADILYGNTYHHIYSLTYRFSPENTCMHKDCEEKAHKRILFNCWGSVCEYDVCEKHTEYDGRCGDDFPSK